MSHRLKQPRFCAVLALAALLPISSVAIGATAPASDVLHVSAYSDLIAAGTCLEHGYPWLVRIGPRDVLCMRSAVGVAKRAVRAQAVIDAAVRQVRGH